MADRTNAGLFGMLFDALATHADESQGDEWLPTGYDDICNLALLLLSLTKGYDFDTSQMECDESLARLGLATRQRHGRYRYVDVPPVGDVPVLQDVVLFPPQLPSPRPGLRVIPPQVIEFGEYSSPEMTEMLAWAMDQSAKAGDEPDEPEPM